MGQRNLFVYDLSLNMFGFYYSKAIRCELIFFLELLLVFVGICPIHPVREECTVPDVLFITGIIKKLHISRFVKLSDTSY